MIMKTNTQWKRPTFAPANEDGYSFSLSEKRILNLTVDLHKVSIYG